MNSIQAEKEKQEAFEQWFIHKRLVLESGTVLFLPKGMALWTVEDEYKSNEFEEEYIVVEKPEHYK